MFDFETNDCYDFIINILFIVTILLLMMYILRYYCNLHFVIKLNKENFEEKVKDKKEESKKEKDKEKVEDKKEEDKTENIKMEEGDIITDNKVMKNDGEKVDKRYYLKDNVFLNDYTATKKDEIKPSTLMIDQLLDKNLQRYYRYVYPRPINDSNFIKKGYNTDDYEPPFNKYSLNPLEYINDDLSAGLAKEADKIILDKKENF